MDKSKAVLFTNYSDKKFTHCWDSVEYEFEPGISMMLEDGLANHFAKHLAVRELNNRESRTDKNVLEIEMQKCFKEDVSVVAEDDTQLKQKTININKKKKPVVKKQEDKKDEFEDLK